MLNDKNTQVECRLDPADKVCQVIRLLRIHAGRRLIQKKQTGLCRQRPGNLQSALLAIRKRRCRHIRLILQADHLDQLHRELPVCHFLPAVQPEGCREDIRLRPHMSRDQNILKDRHGLEQTNVLEGSRNPKLRDAVRCPDDRVGIKLRILAEVILPHLPSRVVFDNRVSLKLHPPICRLIHPGDDIERSRLARPVRTDQRDNFSLVHIERQVVHCHDTAELHRHILHMEDILSWLCHHCAPPCEAFFFRLKTENR